MTWRKSIENWVVTWKLYHRALAIVEKTLGPEHPQTTITLNNLATFYYTQRRYAEAESLYLRSLAISEQTLGPTTLM